ncbi:MAG: right-handed parallel beta-helix repeat-containing protein, partial [Bacteroidetes bacterium]|nr:right-handed parallel beta-helix repeat-containing protein [Bacteroidota bacterium]
MKKILFLLLTCFLCQYSIAQYTYDVTYFPDAGYPGVLNTESYSTTTGWTSLIDGPQAANIWSPTAAIPFPFEFYGSPVTHFKASQNGLLTFDVAATALPNANDNLPSANLPDSTLCFWDEFTNTPSTGTNDDILMQTFGTAPNRQLWVKYYSFEIGNPSASFSYFAFVLEETTNKIYMVEMYGTTPLLTMTVGVQLNNTTAVQYGDNNLSSSGNSTTTATFDYWEFSPVLLVNDNAGIASIDNPVSPITPGMQSVDVTLQNFGLNTLNSVNIEWEVNGATQASVPYAGALASNATTPINLGMYNFPAGVTNIKTWTSSPNGNPDNDTSNDTMEVSLCTALAGTYSIGGASPDFNTLADAVFFLENCGISGPVTFNFAPGTYAGGVEIGPINGASAVNTITFDGIDTSMVTVTHNGSSPNSVFLLAGADYVTITNLTIENTGTIDAWGVRLADTAEWNTISNNRFLMDLTATSDVAAVASSGSGTSVSTSGVNALHTRVLNNYITGGDAGISFYGLTTDHLANADNQFIGNTIMLAYDYGIYSAYQDSNVINNNLITDMRNATGGDGIYTFDQINFTFMSNTIYVPDYGLYVSDGNFDVAPTGQSKLINNMIRSTGDYGIYFDDVEYVDVYHNTSYGEPGIYMNDFVGLDIRNNIFVSSGDYAFETLDAVNTVTVDYNLYFAVPGNTFFVKDGSNTYADLGAWQTAEPGLNGNSLEGDPLFADPATDLHIVGILPNDAGDNSVGVAIDIDGETRPLAPATTVDIGADEFNPAGDDAGVTALVNPVAPFSAGSQSVEISVFNYGINTLNSLDINWIFNGTPQASVPYTGAPVATGSSANVILGNINFPPGTSDLIFWTSNPNGTTDGDLSNDTLVVSVCTALAGAYSIGGATPDFADLAEAVAQLNSCGVSAPVTFTFAPGTYAGGVEIGPINGASTVNTITFDGVDTSLVTVSHNGSLPNSVFLLQGADYVTITNLTIENTGTTDAWGVRLADTAEWNTISNNRFLMSETATADVSAVAASGSGTSVSTSGVNAKHTRVLNNDITGGDAGISFYGLTTDHLANADNQITGNTIKLTYDYGIYTGYQDSIVISNNWISDMRNTSGGDGIYTFDQINFTYMGNSVYVPDYGLYISDGNFDVAPTGQSKLINNMIRSTGDYGIYFDDVEYVDVYHNTSYGEPGLYMNDFIGLDIRNNIFASNGDYAFETADTVNTEMVNYNLYFAAPGNSLFVKDGSNTYPDLAAWQAAEPGLNANSLEGDPLFVDPSTDLHILGVLPNDVGDNSVGVTTDIDGDTRPIAPSTTVDIGADEFT